jgi:hypothetical protein
MTARAEPAMMEPSHKQEVEMKAHLNVVGLIDLVTGVFFTALGVLVSLGVLLFAPWFYGAPLWKPGDVATVFAVVLGVSGVFLVIGIPSLIAGVGLLKKKRWARIVAIMVAILAVTSFPIGTGAGIYTLWVLTHRETEQLLDVAV